MNAFTIIKTGQEDKSVMQKEDLLPGEIWNYSEISGSIRNGPDRDKCLL
jgi:hypothetical protein